VDCDRFHLVASLELDGELTPAEAEALHAHAAACATCRAYEAGLRDVAAALRETTPVGRALTAVSGNDFEP
jgi:anti-sigma factor RsiW